MNVAEIGPVRAAGIKALQVHQFIYERSGGRVGHRLLGVPCLLLYTTGAKTGRARANALTYARDGADYVIVASMGGAPRSPGWYHNLRAQPDVGIRVGTRRMRAHARPVERGDADYERLWELVNANNHNRYRGYQKQTSRPIPLVVLTPA